MDEKTLCERLIAYDTSRHEGLVAAAEFVKGWLESRDLRVEHRDHHGLPVILAEAGPADGPVVVFHGHLDVVPAFEPQFTPRVEGDRLIGRGAYDMKGGLASMMCALQDAAAQDAIRVRFVCVPDEESEDVSERSTDALVEEAARTLEMSRRQAILFDAAARTMDDLPVVPVYIDQDLYAFRAGVEWRPRNDNFLIASEIARVP